MTPAERAQAVISAFAGKKAGFQVRQGNRRLTFTRLPELVRNNDGVVVGIDVMVSLTQGGNPVPIDPHRVIVNPPTVPRARVTENPDGSRTVGAPDPLNAVVEALWNSVDLSLAPKPPPVLAPWPEHLK